MTYELIILIAIKIQKHRCKVLLLQEMRPKIIRQNLIDVLLPNELDGMPSNIKYVCSQIKIESTVIKLYNLGDRTLLHKLQMLKILRCSIVPIFLKLLIQSKYHLVTV